KAPRTPARAASLTMVWKPKEKELTPEEAVAAAKKELAPFWHGSPPLLAGVLSPQGVTAHPLDPAFGAKSWLLFFLDPTDAAGESAFSYARELHRRYHQHNVGCLLVFRP